MSDPLTNRALMGFLAGAEHQTGTEHLLGTDYDYEVDYDDEE